MNDAAKPLTDLAGKLGDLARKIDPPKAQSTAYPDSMSGVKRANEQVRAQRDLGGPRRTPYLKRGK
jgi:hypothetical protein